MCGLPGTQGGDTRKARGRGDRWTGEEESFRVRDRGEGEAGGAIGG